LVPSAGEGFHVGGDDEAGSNAGILAEALGRSLGAGDVLGPFDLDVAPLELSRVQDVVEHADVGPLFLRSDLLALEVIQGGQATAGNEVVAPGPCQLQEDHRPRAVVAAEGLGYLAQHAHGAAQEGTFALLVILDLLSEVVAAREPELEAMLVEDAAGSGG